MRENILVHSWLPPYCLMVVELVRNDLRYHVPNKDLALEIRLLVYKLWFHRCRPPG